MGLVVNGCIPLFYNYVGCRPYGLRAMLLVAFPCFVCGRSRRTGNKVQVWSEVDELVCVWVTVLACVFCSMSVSVVPIWCICLIYRSVFISRCCIVGRWYASWNIFSSAFLAEGLGGVFCRNDDCCADSMIGLSALLRIHACLFVWIGVCGMFVDGLL